MSRVIVAALAAAILVPSCMVRPIRPWRHEVTVYDGAVEVDQEPPPLQMEIIPAAPSPAHVWVAGTWRWGGAAWAWVPGAWVCRPHPAAVWVSGGWNCRGRRWVWAPGYWRH